MKKLYGKYAVITGANQGLGKIIAQSYIEAGASIFICARGGELLEQARDELMQQCISGQTAGAVAVDVSNPADVDRLFKLVFDTFPRLDILVNNAGVHGPKGAVEDADWDKWVKAVEINLYGAVLTCRAALKHFKKNRCGKIVNLSGGGATKPMPYVSAYAASKAALARFSETLAEEVKKFNIDVNLIAPGALNTRLMDDILNAGPEKAGEALYNEKVRQRENGGSPPEMAAQLAVYLGSSESDGITGKLISAVWDPWERLHEYREQLKNSDIYTLRRIIPKERGADWGER